MGNGFGGSGAGVGSAQAQGPEWEPHEGPARQCSGEKPNLQVKSRSGSNRTRVRRSSPAQGHVSRAGDKVPQRTLRLQVVETPGKSLWNDSGRNGFLSPS